MVYLFPLDARMKDVLRGSAKVTTVQVSIDFLTSNEDRFELAVAGMDRLLAFEEEKTRAGTMVPLDESYFDAVRVGNLGGDVHRQWLNPLLVDLEHMHNEIGSALRAIDRPILPGRREIGVVIRMCMAKRGVSKDRLHKRKTRT